MDGDSWLLLSILFYLMILFWAIGYSFFVKKVKLLDPIFIFLFFLTLFTLPLPLRAFFTKKIEGDVTEHLPFLLPYIPWAVFFTGIGIIFFVWGYYTKYFKGLVWYIPYPGKNVNKNVYFPIVLIGLFSLFLLFLLSKDFGGILNFILLGYNSSAEMFGKGYLAVGFPWLFVVTLMLLYRFAKFRKKKDKYLFFISFALVAIANLVMGNRGMIMYMIITIILFYNHAIKEITIKKLLLVSLSLFLALNIVGYLRSSKYNSLSDFFLRTSQSYTNVSSAGGVNKGLFYTLTTGEFIVPFETFPQMIKSFGDEVLPLYGSSYIRAPLFYIPSALYSDRPLPLTNWYMEQFYGSGYGLNQGRAFFFLAEAYLNFGPAGVFALMFLWGVALNILYRYRYFSKGEPGVVMIYSLIIAFMFRCIAGDSVSLLVGIPEQSLIPAILFLLLATRFRGWYFLRPIK